MKKILPLSLFLCGTLALFAFSSAPVENIKYSNVTTAVKSKSLGLKQVNAFSEAEDSATTSDKGTWVKRHKVWTEITNNGISNIETVLSKN